MEGTFSERTHNLNYYFTANHEGENNEKTVKKHNRRGEQPELRIIY